MNGLPSSPIGDRVYGTPVPTTGPLGPAYGYTVGGLGHSLYQRVDYSNDTATATNQAHTTNSSALSLSVGNNTHAFSWVSGGQGQFSSIVERYDYSADTTDSVAKGNFPGEKSYLAGAVGNVSYGYFMGGRNPANSDTSDVLRVDYSNDTAAAAPKGPLTSARYHNDGGVGNQSYGYMGGDGLVSGSDIDRIDYSNDTATALGKGNLSVNGGVKAATGNASYGYWGGGYPTRSTVSRLDYSNDSANTVDKGPLTVATIQLGAFGDTSYGYWSGGHPGPLSTVSRLDYSDDTTTSVSKGPLVQGVREQGGNSSRSNANVGAPSSPKPPRRRFYDGAVDTTQTSVPVGTSPRGYFGGGWNNNFDGNPWYTYSMVERYNFDNDTAMAAPRGNLPNNGSYNMAGISIPAFSYFFGGSFYAGTFPFQYKSNAERLDHSNDLIINRRGTSNPIRYAAVTGNSNFAYISGSIYPAPYNPSPYTQLSSIVRFDFSNDNGAFNPTAAISSISTPTARAAVSSPAFGYYGGGHVSPAPISTVERIDFANDTSNLVAKGPLSVGRQALGATGTSSYGYFAGGYQNPGGTYRTTIDRIDYSSDTSTAVAKGPLTVIKKEFGSVSSDSYGYFGGGYNVIPGGNNYISSTDRLDFSNDTATTVARGNLSRNRNQIAGTSAKVTATAPVQPPFSSPTELYNPANNLAGGYTLGSGTNVQRINYSNDTATATSKGNLTAALSYHSAVSSFTHGYALAGNNPSAPGFRSIVQRVDYSNDTATAPSIANLAQDSYRTYSGMGNKTYGYQSGGQRPSGTGTSQIDRIEYANDTATGLQKGNLASSRYLQTATGNLSYGYVCGGSPPFQNNSLIQRVDYGNDTATAAPKGPLHQGSRKLSATGTASYGYVAGGTNPDLSSTTRIDYSNDTATSVQKGSMTITRQNFASMSSPAYGYYTGGSQPDKSSTDRIDYSNDTATASPKGVLAVAVSYFSAASGADIAGALQ